MKDAASSNACRSGKNIGSLPVARVSADEAIAALYAAAVDPDQWDAALNAIARLADARGANCFVHDVATGRFLEYRFVGYEADWANLYSQHYHTLDLARQVLARQPVGSMYPMHRFISNDVVNASEYYQDFYIPWGFRYSCGGTQIDGDKRLILAVHRPVGHRPYEDETVSDLQRVLQHLSNPFRIRALTLQTRQNGLRSAAALDAIQRAIIIVDACLNVQYLNGAAHALLIRSRSVRVVWDRLAISEQQLEHQLARRVREACRPTPLISPVPLYAMDESGRASLELTVVPLRPEAADGISRPEPMAMVTIRHLVPSTQWEHATQRPFGLSRAEMALAAGLVAGLTPSEYAARKGVKISTVRSQIQSILMKTGTRRAAEIAALFATLEMPDPTVTTGRPT